MSSTTENRSRNGQTEPNEDSEPVTLPFAPPMTQERKPPRKKPRRKSAGNRLGVNQQKDFLELMIKGASPQVACHQLKVTLSAFWNTLEHDARFTAELQRVWDTLSFNVVAALYQAAIKGNGPAQQFWLKHRPPPRWAVTPTESNPTDELDTLTDAELLDRARAEAPDLADEIAARIAAATGGFPPAGLSEAAESPGD